jgi:hypothetical protein
MSQERYLIRGFSWDIREILLNRISYGLIP